MHFVNGHLEPMDWNVVNSCLVVEDLFFEIAAALVLQLSIYLSTSFTDFCLQKMMVVVLAVWHGSRATILLWYEG